MSREWEVCNVCLTEYRVPEGYNKRSTCRECWARYLERKHRERPEEER